MVVEVISDHGCLMRSPTKEEEQTLLSIRNDDVGHSYHDRHICLHEMMISPAPIGGSAGIFEHEEKVVGALCKDEVGPEESRRALYCTVQ
jgi:hypothetical protein